MGSTAAFRRQDPRIFAGLSVTVLSTRPRLEATTWDVSFRGLFLCTATPRPVRQLVRFSLTSPATGRELLLHGMVVNVIGPDDPEGRPQGMGVELYAVEPEARGAWWELVRFVRDHPDDPRSGVRRA